MPAARYWRAVGLQSVGGGALELSALHLYLGGARVDAAATLTSTFAPASGSLAALQDTDTATAARWLDVSAPGFALVWDFGAGNAQDVAAVRLGAGALYAEWLETLTLQHSSDGVVWTTLWSIPAFSWPGVSTLQAVPSGGDEHFRAVSLLLHMDGADGSTTFTDSSATPKVATAYGNAKISTAQSKFGPSSVLLDGDGDFLRFVSSAEFGFGVGDFTVESWFYPLSAQTGIIVDARVNNTAELWFFYWDLQKINFYTPSATLTSTSTASLNTWHHLSVTRQSGVLRLFIDGALAGTSTNTSDLGASVPICVGANPAGRSNLHGYIDDLRITKGLARYTANFTPPTLPFADGAVDAVAAPPLLRAPMPERACIAASAPVPPRSTLSAPRLLTARNLEFAGTGTASATGTIYGSTAIKGSPNAPARAKVSLLRARDLMLVQQTWSDPTTGAYAFHGLDPFGKYTTLAEYPTGDYRAVAADQLTPDIEEARAP